MRQRAKLAQAIVHEPDVLLLDEPLTGTDPTSRALILEQVKKRAALGAVVVFSTHVLHEVEALTDRVLLIARGQLVAQGRVQEIRDLLEEHPHQIRVECDQPRRLAQHLTGDEAVTGLRFAGSEALEIETSAPDDTYSLLGRALVESGFQVRSITSPDATLEALFHYLVEKSSHMAGTGADAGVGRHRGLGAGSDRSATDRASGSSSTTHQTTPHRPAESGAPEPAAQSDRSSEAKP
jgi:ABC-2 type transport system ATP-binding protein